MEGVAGLKELVDACVRENCYTRLLIVTRRLPLGIPGSSKEFTSSDRRERKARELRRHRQCNIGIAGPFRTNFDAILLHNCYTRMQCHKKRTHAV